MGNKCKHLNGEFQENIVAYHSRMVINGKLDKESFNNDYGGLINHSYKCKDCNKLWEWKLRPRAKWLNELFETAYSHD